MQVEAMVLLQNLTADCNAEDLKGFEEWMQLASTSEREFLLLPQQLLPQGGKQDEQHLQGALMTAAINTINNLLAGSEAALFAATLMPCASSLPLTLAKMFPQRLLVQKLTAVTSLVARCPFRS